MVLTLGASAGAVVPTNLPVGGFLKKGDLLRNPGEAAPRWNKLIIGSKKSRMSQEIDTVDGAGHHPHPPSGQELPQVLASDGSQLTSSLEIFLLLPNGTDSPRLFPLPQAAYTQ